MEHTASSFFHITKRLIEERFTLDMDSTARHLNIVGDVVNLVPIYWITEEIVSSSPLHYLQAVDNVHEGGSTYQIQDRSGWGCKGCV